MKNIIKKVLSVAFVFSLFFMGGQQALAYTPGYVSSSASNVTQTSATFNATMNPSGLNTNAWFETSTSGQLGYQNIGSGASNVVMTPYTMSGLTPSTTYSFRVVANNATGTTYGPWISFTTSSNNNPPPTIPSATLTANPTTVTAGGSSTISWTVSNATSCTGSNGTAGWAGPKSINGGNFVASPINSNTQFTLYCVNNYGSVTKNVWVYVTTPPAVPTVNINANPTTVVAGGSTTLSWNSTNATSCSANASPSNSGWTGPKNLNGSQTVSNINVSTTFTLVCQNASGNASDAVLVYTTTPPPQGSAPVVNVTVSPTSIVAGNSATLSWTSTNNPTSCYGSWGNWAGPVATNGSQSVSPSVTTTYNISCTNAYGTGNDYATLTVTQLPPPPPPSAPTVNLVANPTFVSYGGSANLSWYVTNATSCTANSNPATAWTGNKNANGGTQTISNLTSTTYFNITCTGAGGSASDTVYVTVGNQPPPPPPPSAPTVNLTASPTSVAYGGTSTLSWSSTNATSCMASGGVNGWAGAKNTSGYFPTGALTNTTTYTITCTGAGGSASDFVTVFVGNQPPPPPVPTPTVNLTANPTSVTYNGSTTLSWTVTNATFCIASGGWSGNTSNTNGSYVVNGLTSSTSFTLTCTNASGSASDFATVSVSGQPNTNLPLVTTNAVNSVGTNYATLNGFVNANGGSNVSAWFEWGTNGNYGNITTQSNYGSTTGTSYSYVLGGLQSNTSYYYRAVAQNASGQVVYGSQMSFTTTGTPIYNPPYNPPYIPPYNPCGIFNSSCAPTAITTFATNIGQTSTRLNGLGLVNNNVLTTGYFEWGTTQFLGNTTPSQMIGSSASNPFFYSAFGLSPNTTYFYRAVVTNQYGTSRGDIVTFRTTPVNIVVNTGTNTNVITRTNVVYRDVVVNTNTTANLVAGVSKPSLVFLGVNCNNQVLVPGEIFECVVNWKNVSNKNLSDVLLRVGFPKELTFLQASRGYFSEVDNAVVVEIVNLAPGEESSMVFTTRVREDAQLGKVVVVAGSLVYSYTGDNGAFAQEEVFAYSNHTIQGGLQLQGATVLGASYLPSSLLGWLLLLLIILLIILLARMAYNSTRPHTVIVPEHKEHV